MTRVSCPKMTIGQELALKIQMTVRDVREYCKFVVKSRLNANYFF